MSAFPRFIRLAEQGKNLLFCDEAIFTSKQINLKVWYTKGFNQKIKKKKLHFGAIAVVAAIAAVIGASVAVSIPLTLALAGDVHCRLCSNNECRWVSEDGASTLVSYRFARRLGNPMCRAVAGKRRVCP